MMSLRGVHRFAVLFLIVVLLSACSSSSNLTQKPSAGKSLVQVDIDWSTLSGINIGPSALPVGAVNAHVNTIGARLVYPEENAAFTQAISRQDAAANNILTLEVPATNRAHLYLVAVNMENRTAYSYAMAENLRLEKDSVVALTIDDFQWIEAAWHFDDDYDDYATSIENGRIELPFSEHEVLTRIKVRDPFQEGKEASYDTSLIGHYGISSMRENIGGWLYFDAYLRNQFTGTPNVDTHHWFQPCVDGIQFNLGNKGYYIPPVIKTITVEWK
jgi:hypothetical protein